MKLFLLFCVIWFTLEVIATANQINNGDISPVTGGIGIIVAIVMLVWASSLLYHLP